MPDIKDLVKKMDDADPAVAHHAYRDLENVATRAGQPGHGAADVAAALAAEINARGEPKKDKDGKEKPGDLLHSTDVRRRVIRLLNYVASEQEVPVLAELTGDLDLREMARFTLDRDSSDAATGALIKALDEVGPDFRVGVVGALAKRKGGRVLDALKKAADDDEKPVRVAAVEALASFPDPSIDEIMVKATKADCSDCRTRAHRARLRLAGTLAKAGDQTAATRIYEAIGRSDAGEPEKQAAARALEAAR